MAQTTSVLWSVDQGLGENAKEQARQNIGAASVKSVDDVKSDLNNLSEVVNNHTTEIGQIKEDVQGIESSLTNKKDKQSENTFTGSATKTIKNISQNANGELSVEFEDIDLPKKVVVKLKSDKENTSILKDSTNTVESLIYTGNNYKEYAGNIGFTTTSSGNMSICAFNTNKQLIYPTQCVNFSGPFVGGVTNFIPFIFKEEPNKERISYIGIKGASNGNADITHLFYIGKK